MDSSEDPTDQELAAYLDEMLAAERSAAVERLLREREDLRQRASQLARRRDQGGHTLGEIWRRRRLSCPTRNQLADFLNQTIDAARSDYYEFHLKTIGCRICQANLEDLKTLPAGQNSPTFQRRERLFESSAGLLRSNRGGSD